MQNLYPLEKLYLELRKLGLPSGKFWRIREEKKGNLLFRRLPNGYRVVTDDDIREIVKAYYPGGEGFWRWQDGPDPTKK